MTLPSTEPYNSACGMESSGAPSIGPPLGLRVFYTPILDHLPVVILFLTACVNFALSSY